MVLAHACITVSLSLPRSHNRSPARGETYEKDDDEAVEARAAGDCEQEAEEEEDAGGRVVDVAGAKVMGISFSRVCHSVYVSLLPPSFPLFVGELFSGTRGLRPLSCLRSTLYDDRGACIPRRCITIVRAKSASC